MGSVHCLELTLPLGLGACFDGQSCRCDGGEVLTLVGGQARLPTGLFWLCKGSRSSPLPVTGSPPLPGTGSFPLPESGNGSSLTLLKKKGSHCQAHYHPRLWTWLSPLDLQRIWMWLNSSCLQAPTDGRAHDGQGSWRLLFHVGVGALNVVPALGQSLPQSHQGLEAQLPLELHAALSLAASTRRRVTISASNLLSWDWSSVCSASVRSCGGFLCAYRGLLCTWHGLRKKIFIKRVQVQFLVESNSWPVEK